MTRRIYRIGGVGAGVGAYATDDEYETIITRRKRQPDLAQTLKYIKIKEEPPKPKVIYSYNAIKRSPSRRRVVYVDDDDDYEENNYAEVLVTPRPRRTKSRMYLVQQDDDDEDYKYDSDDDDRRRFGFATMSRDRTYKANNRSLSYESPRRLVVETPPGDVFINNKKRNNHRRQLAELKVRDKPLENRPVIRGGAVVYK